MRTHENKVVLEANSLRMTAGRVVVFVVLALLGNLRLAAAHLFGSDVVVVVDDLDIVDIASQVANLVLKHVRVEVRLGQIALQDFALLLQLLHLPLEGRLDGRGHRVQDTQHPPQSQCHQQVEQILETFVDQEGDIEPEGDEDNHKVERHLPVQKVAPGEGVEANHEVHVEEEEDADARQVEVVLQVLQHVMIMTHAAVVTITTTTMGVGNRTRRYKVSTRFGGRLHRRMSGLVMLLTGGDALQTSGCAEQLKFDDHLAQHHETVEYDQHHQRQLEVVGVQYILQPTIERLLVAHRVDQLVGGGHVAIALQPWIAHLEVYGGLRAQIAIRSRPCIGIQMIELPIALVIQIRMRHVSRTTLQL